MSSVNLIISQTSMYYAPLTITWYIMVNISHVLIDTQLFLGKPYEETVCLIIIISATAPYVQCELQTPNRDGEHILHKSIF